jgi:hypothetical protein
MNPLTLLPGSLREIEEADELLDELAMLLDIVTSHAISAREAAWRRDREVAGAHLRHARDGLKLALRTYNELGAEPREIAGTK